MTKFRSKSERIHQRFMAENPPMTAAEIAEERRLGPNSPLEPLVDNLTSEAAKGVEGPSIEVPESWQPAINENDENEVAGSEIAPIRKSQ